ncbi:hypothetical protein [Halomonas lysinitropha]|uniref:Uncharacterized protein n=1 Tax=Halomonas lysinitropha TaxID=2607506 RepID=A0A5K1I497_9GAMM|nr:hypothetical protein [Halomonas lysinitropha]VVZ95048.1 hypothetical protein HALO32_01112 [Halomonas lysinitropha]
MTSPARRSRLVFILVCLAGMTMMIPTASAYNIHQLGSQHFVIVCEDETTFSIHSNLEGAVTNADILCRNEGNIAGNNPTVVRASRELARDIDVCQRSGGKRVNSAVMGCPTPASISKRSARTGRPSE